jgi:hypothetical protein
MTKPTKRRKRAKEEELDDLSYNLLEAYYVVSEFAYDTSDPVERENRMHLKSTRHEALSDGASDEDMYDALGYVLTWVNGDCFEKPPAWAKLLAKPFLRLKAGEYSGRVCGM